MTPHDEQLLRTLEGADERFPVCFALWAHVACEGRVYVPKPVDDDWLMMMPGYCFDNACETAEEYGLDYVEGYALSASIPGLPVHHAWNVTRDGHVLDVTWPKVGLAYRGIEFDIEEVRMARDAEMSMFTWQRVVT